MKANEQMPFMNEVTLGQTLISLGITEGWSVVDNKVRWSEEYEGVKIPIEKIKEKQKQLQLIKDAEKYKEDRKEAYPAIEKQLDMLFHDIRLGQLAKKGKFYKAIKQIKDKYPKEAE
jgi:hypothetical protein